MKYLASFTITFAAMKMREHYDKHQQPKSFKVGDLVNLRVHFPLVKATGRIDREYIGHFKVLERICRLIGIKNGGKDAPLSKSPQKA
jgi:hypothetical protein